MEPDEPPRVKFLCSFGGSILPRPLDGRLRYVGGETRIVTAPRDVSYSGLLARMQELFDGATSIKYQQPDEDLDALVSVVNDDDVMNMMEEHDKLSAASGDGFTRLRIFLFSPDLDAAAAAALSLSHFDIDDREAERRYVDALNSLVDEQQQQQQQQFPAHPTIDQAQAQPTTLQHHITIPHHGQRYGEIEPPWSPAHFSPGHHVRDFPPSPSTANFHLAGEFSDRDEYIRQSTSRLVMQPYEQQQQSSPPLMESMLWPPPGAAMVQEKGGFPGNLFHAHNVFDGRTCVCEHCRMGFPRSPAPMSDPRYIRNHGQSHMDHQSKIGNEYIGHFSNSCAECYRNREAYMLNQDAKLDPAIYLKEQSEHHHPFYNEAQVPDKGWFLHHHQAGHRLEDPRAHTSGSGRVSEHFAIDGNPINVPFVPGNYYDGQLTPPNYINHDDSRFLQPGTELGSEALHAQHDAGDGSRTHIPGLEDSTLRYGNHPSAYGADNLYQVQQNLPPIQSLRRKAPIPLHPGSSYESSGMTMPNGGISAGFARSPPQDGSPRLSRIRAENQVQNSWVGQNGGTLQKIIGFDAPASLDYLYDHAPRKVQNIVGQDGRISIITDPSQCQHGMLHVDIPSDAVPLAPTFIDDNMATSITSGYHHFSKMGNEEAPLIRVLEERSPFAETYQTNHGEASMETNMLTSPCLNEKQNANFDANKLKPAESECLIVNVEDPEANAAKGHTDISVECLDFLPGLIASVRKIALESAEVVKTKVEMDTDENPPPSPGKKDSSLHEVEPKNAGADSDGDGEHQKISKIEPTTAEAEALAKGLQTIRNDDLEEIRELGSGTYGAVYHGKWKGSDVAIKRIKASCFAGRPSERERLIADFWKEALILSSLHHPNVVSLYGVVRDGPDGSLATVTEFMVNGSLKQFLQKKDRTIDRRKRLIIAMDAAFGMEYLHGKNIVHFDLKCENLLVNMRDPHRPVCKIGDLGLSKVKQCTLVSGGVRGTLPWMAPELLSGKSNMVTEKIDVYSFGIVMWELLTGEEPYSEMHYASIIGGIVNNTLRPQTPTWCDPEWKSLMEGCWSSDPGERPSFSEISQKLRKMAAAINVK